MEEHPHAARGITELSLHGIRLELKSEKVNRIVLADRELFVPQARAMRGKRLTVLCVLDGSPKAQPAFPVEDGIGVFIH